MLGLFTVKTIIVQVSVALQKLCNRERKGGTDILQLAPYFYYPINEAAKLLKICPTVLKKICRKHGLRRWPHRKLQSIERAIEKYQALIAAAKKEQTPSQIAPLLRRVRELQTEKEALCFGK